MTKFRLSGNEVIGLELRDMIIGSYPGVSVSSYYIYSKNLVFRRHTSSSNRISTFERASQRLVAIFETRNFVSLV